ncbi:MAG: PadR family transcriptional regulator [Acidobacteria bacterium]|nr:PadR family transcriptional regulator [Acidobacteriota bacterium]
MKLLSRSEEMVLITILKLKEDAYGVAIRKKLYEETGTRWSFGSIYTALNTLTRKRYASKRMGEPTAERGGRHKCIYEVTAEGKKALREIRKVQESVWADLPDVALD